MQRSVLAVTAVLALLLSGCTAESAQPLPSTPSTPSPSTTQSPSATPEIDMVAEALKVLGPVPAAIPLTKEQEETARLAEVERSWTVVLTQFPDAQRPAVQFEHYVKGDEVWKSELACLRDQGIKVDLAANGKGETAGFSLNPPPGDELRQSVAFWGCNVRFPLRPRAPLTMEQRGYLYDYLTQFVVRCYEARGGWVSAPPPKDIFVAKWPHQEWWPSTNRNNNDLDYDAMDDACQVSMPGMN